MADEDSTTLADDGETCRRLREQIDVMAQDMRHRLRNAYAVSSAIVSASGREQPEHREFADAVAQRLNSLSLAQAVLLEKGTRHTLRTLAERVVGSFDPHCRHAALIDLPDEELNDQQVRLAALVLGELATNSCKYGALGHDGSIRIAASTDGAGLHLTWTEELGSSASPVCEGRKMDGSSGHNLMTRMARAHGGSFDAGWTGDRLVARLTIPRSDGEGA